MARKIFIILFSLPLLFSQSIIRSSTGGNGATGAVGAVGPSSDGSKVYGVGGNTTLELTIAAAGVNGTVSIPDGSAISLSSSVTISDPVKIKCGPGATITKAANMTQMFNITGANVSINGCILNGAQASGYTGFIISLGSAATGFRLYNSVIENAASTAISMGSTNDVEIASNSFSGNIGTAIYGFGSATKLRVHDNYIDASDVTAFHKGIAFHSNSGSNRITDVVVANNYILGGNSFCVEIGAFSGLAPQRISVSGNVCNQNTSATGFGGYSFDTCDGLTVTGNSYDNETARDASLAGIELVGGTAAVVTGNTVTGATIAINQQTRSVVSGNRIKRLWAGTGVYIGSSTTTSVNNNLVSSNIIDMSGITDVSGSIYGIWHQCNHAGIDCSNDQIIGNTLINDNNLTVTSIGLVFQNAGTVANTFVSSNKFISWPTCYALGSGSVNTILLYNDESGCTALGSYAGSATTIYISRGITNILNQGGFYPPTAMGSSGQVLTSNGATTPASFQSYTGVITMPNSSRTTFMFANGGAATSGFGDSCTAIGTASASAATSTDPARTNYVSAATSTNQAGCQSNANYWGTRHPVFQTFAELPAGGDFVVSRTWITLSNAAVATLGASDTPTGTTIGFRASTAVPDTNWQCGSSNAGSWTFVDTGIPINTTGHKFEADYSDGTNVVCRIDGNVVGTISSANVPGSTGLGVRIINTTLENVAKNLKIGWIAIKSDQ